MKSLENAANTFLSSFGGLWEPTKYKITEMVFQYFWNLISVSI